MTLRLFMSLICKTVIPIICISLGMNRSHNIWSSFKVIVLLYNFRCTMQFSTEPLKRHGDGRKTEMRLHSLTKLLRSPDIIFILFLQNFGTPQINVVFVFKILMVEKTRWKEKLHECSSPASDRKVSWANVIVLRGIVVSWVNAIVLRGIVVSLGECNSFARDRSFFGWMQ